MRSTLCEAVARCHLRRLRGVAAAAPLPAAIVALVVVDRARHPLPARWCRRRRGGGQHRRSPASPTPSCSDRCWQPPSRAQRSRSRHRRDRRSAIRSPQAHRARRSPLSALTLVPAAAGSIVVVPSLVALCAGLARALPGGAAGGRCARCGDARRGSRRRRRRRRRARRRAPAAPPRGRRRRRGAWAGSWSVSLSEPARSGRSRSCRAALRGAGSPWLALGVSSGVGIGLAAAWVALAGNARRASVPSSRSGALRSTTPAGTDCRGRAARAEGRPEARDARCSALRPRRVGACGRDRRASARIVPARHDDGIARIAPVPTRRRRGARRRPLALARRTRPERRDRAVVRAREHRCGRAPGRGRRQRRRRRLRCGRGRSSASSRRSSSPARAWHCSPARCSRGAAREPEIR